MAEIQTASYWTYSALDRVENLLCYALCSVPTQTVGSRLEFSPCLSSDQLIWQPERQRAGLRRDLRESLEDLRGK